MPVSADENRQARVDDYFDSASGYWSTVYETRDTQGLVYRRRMAAALRWAGELGLPAGARALDAGCGAGLLSGELAALGLAVTGTDSSPEMVRTAAANLARRGLTEAVTVRQADVHRLPFAAAQFHLVVALGLLPWLHDAPGAVRELGRVLCPGGMMILSADNRYRLNRPVEPRENPLLNPLRPIKRMLSAPDDSAAPSYRHSPREVDALLAGAGVAAIRRTTIGYGPFTVLGRELLPGRLGVAVDERLQLACARHPRLRGAGWHYLVAGVKAHD